MGRRESVARDIERMRAGGTVVVGPAVVTLSLLILGFLAVGGFVLAGSWKALTIARDVLMTREATDPLLYIELLVDVVTLALGVVALTLDWTGILFFTRRLFVDRRRLVLDSRGVREERRRAGEWRREAFIPWAQVRGAAIDGFIGQRKRRLRLLLHEARDAFASTDPHL